MEHWNAGNGSVGIIDYSTRMLGNIKPQDESFLDGIRMIFEKHLRKLAMDFYAELKKGVIKYLRN